MLLEEHDGGASLVRLVDGERTEAPAPAPNGPGSPALIWDQLLWLEDDPDVDCEIDEEEEEPEICLGQQLHARPALEDGEPTLVGAVGAESTGMRGCRTDEALAVVVDGANVEGNRTVAVAFLADGAWSTPRTAHGSSFEYALTCRGREATLTWVRSTEGVRQVFQVRCTPEGCEEAERDVGRAGSDPVATDLAGRVLLVWSEDGHTRGRLAPLSELDRASDLGGLPAPASPILSRHLYVRGEAAALVFRTAAGVGAARIDAAGRVEPLSRLSAVRREEP